MADQQRNWEVSEPKDRAVDGFEKTEGGFFTNDHPTSTQDSRVQLSPRRYLNGSFVCPVMFTRGREEKGLTLVCILKIVKTTQKKNLLAQIKIFLRLYLNLVRRCQ